MKHRILKRVIALCIAGGVMAFSLAACGDSEENNEGTGTVQDVSQDTAREDEDGTVGVNENGDAVNADSSGNDVRVAHASSSGNSGNGFAIPVFKPGEEPDFGQELQPGEEPQPGAGSKPGTGTQNPPSNAGTGTQTGEGPQQPQSSAGAQQPQQPQPNSGTQQPQQPQPNSGTQRPQQSQPTKPSSGTQTSGGTQSGTGAQTAHTHNFQGGNCSTPATCSCGATGSYGSHNWVTKTIHHDATGHYESVVVRTEEGIIGYKPKNRTVYKCNDCDFFVDITYENDVTTAAKKEGHKNSTGHSGFKFVRIDGGEPIYGTIDITEDVWVQDTAAWDEKVTTCSICGAKQ